jgi:hypothetical protein
MKKMKNIKLLRIFSILILGAITLNSCDQLIDPTELDFGKGPVLATFAEPVTEVNIIKDAANTPIPYEFELTYSGGKNVALDKDVTITIATSSESEALEGVEFELPTKTFTIPAGSTTSTGSLTILTGGLVPFDFKDIILEIVDSSESIAELNTINITLKALDANTLAGDYTAEVNEYWNSGRFLGDFDGAHFTIAAISPGLYLQYGFGPFPDGGDFYFRVDESTGVITTTGKDLDGEVTLLNSSPMMTCAGGQFEMVTCDETTNKATLSPDGHHIVETTVGYYRGAGATREFKMKLIRD